MITISSSFSFSLCLINIIVWLCCFFCCLFVVTPTTTITNIQTSKMLPNIKTAGNITNITNHYYYYHNDNLLDKSKSQCSEKALRKAGLQMTKAIGFGSNFRPFPSTLAKLKSYCK